MGDEPKKLESIEFYTTEEQTNTYYSLCPKCGTKYNRIALYALLDHLYLA
jgi:uncharacterized OB-fold protein